MFIITASGGFGDALLAGLFTQILRDNGLDAYLDCDRDAVRDVIDCPLATSRHVGERYRWHYGDIESDNRKSFLSHSLAAFAATYNLPPLKVTRQYVPVVFRRDVSAPTVDVTICSQGGSWTPYRAWPHFKELKRRLAPFGISYIDMSEQGILGQACLNHVYNSRVYLGIDTGMSHLVSQVARQGLIVQGGYNNAEQWSTYGYEYVSVPVNCSPCFLREGCPHAHKCMTAITVDLVLKKLLKMLG